MKTKRLLALICVLALMLALAGCGNTAVKDDSGTDPAETPADASAPTDDNVFGAFDPDDVVLTIDGTDCTWYEYYYFLNYYIGYVEHYNGEVEDWNEDFGEGLTAQDVVKNACLDWLVYNEAVKNGAEKLGVELDAEDYAYIDAEIAAMEENAGGAEAFDQMLVEMNLSREFYIAMNKTAALSDKCFVETYGENGSKLSDEDIAEYTADDGYLMAKHILIKTVTTDESGQNVPLSDDEVSEAYAKICDIRDQLASCSEGELENTFDQLMHEYSEDTGGLAMYPDGYLFQDGEMVPEFENGTKALEIGEVSDIIETSYGYHIILRLPIDYNTTPNAYSSYMASGYSTYTLRNLTAMEMFDAVIDGWREDINVKFGKVYDKIDLAELFKK